MMPIGNWNIKPGKAELCRNSSERVPGTAALVRRARVAPDRAVMTESSLQQRLLLDVAWTNDMFTVCLICVRIKAVAAVSGGSVLSGHLLHLRARRLLSKSVPWVFTGCETLLLAATLFPSLCGGQLFICLSVSLEDLLSFWVRPHGLCHAWAPTALSTSSLLRDQEEFWGLQVQFAAAGDSHLVQVMNLSKINYWN